MNKKVLSIVSVVTISFALLNLPDLSHPKSVDDSIFIASHVKAYREKFGVLPLEDDLLKICQPENNCYLNKLLNGSYSYQIVGKKNKVFIIWSNYELMPDKKARIYLYRDNGNGFERTKLLES